MVKISGIDVTARVIPKSQMVLAWKELTRKPFPRVKAYRLTDEDFDRVIRLRRCEEDLERENKKCRPGKSRKYETVEKMG